MEGLYLSDLFGFNRGPYILCLRKSERFIGFYKWKAQGLRCLLRVDSELKSSYQFFSLSLSLSHTHTHTHTHTQHSLMVRGMTSSSDSSPAGAGRVQEAWAEEGGQSPPSSPAPPCSRCFPAGGRRHFLPFCQPSRAPMDSVLPEGLCSLTTF